MKTRYEAVKDWRRNTKLRLSSSFGNKCGICGYDRCVEAFEFHHLQPDNKEFSLSSGMSWDKIVVEARKCVMLCSNCHREVHNDISTIPEDVKRFDENFVNYIPEKLCDECPICGALKSIARLTCSISCAAKKKSNIKWADYNLKELYEEIGTYTGVAKYIGNISDVSVKKRMMREGIIS